MIRLAFLIGVILTSESFGSDEDPGPDLKSLRATLDKTSFGMNKVKDSIIEFLSTQSYIIPLGPHPLSRSRTIIVSPTFQATWQPWSRISLDGVLPETLPRPSTSTQGNGNSIILLDEIDGIIKKELSFFTRIANPSS